MQGDFLASDSGPQQAVISAFLADEPGAADTLDGLLRPHITSVTSIFLKPDDKDCDDVVQETILAVFGYVRKREGFSGILESFAATIAKNRCRDILRARQRSRQHSIESLQEWIGDDKKSALEFLADQEIDAIVRESVGSMDPQCRQLLDTVLYAEKSIAQVSRQLGLNSVQSAYYRRAICLRKVLKVLKIRLSDSSIFG